MKLKTLLFTFLCLFAVTTLMAEDDIIVIEGGAANGGIIETTINGDTTATGERANPNRIYELKAGEFYLMHAPINVTNHGGTITIRGQEGGRKPVIIKQPLNEVAIGASNIRSSFVFQNIQYHSMALDGAFSWSEFNINGDNHTLLVEDVMMENCNGILFNMNGVKAGCEAVIRDSYFRDLQNGSGSQWWAGRVLQAKVPIDKLIYENNTTTGAGLTVLCQGSLIEYAVINHNTFINNRKYPFLNQRWKEVYFTNNLFVNANWVGEDKENVATGGQDPDALLHGIVGVDTLDMTIAYNPKFITEDSTLSEEVDEISDIIFYAADNVVVSSKEFDNYYSGGLNSEFDAPASYLDWGGLGNGPWKVVSVPGIWANERTTAMVNDWDNLKMENNSVYEMSVDELGFVTNPLTQAGADILAQWNQNKWGVPGVESPTEGWAEHVHFGDYDPTTVPGVEVEAAASGKGGISKISDMVEDFSYSKQLISACDGLRIGALHWNDEEFDGVASLENIKNAYNNGVYVSVEETAGFQFEGLKNYPNPFSNSTKISFNLASDANVNLSVFDTSGRLVSTLVNEKRQQGSYEVNFVAPNINPGTYFYRLTTDSKTVTKKMILVK